MGTELCLWICEEEILAILLLKQIRRSIWSDCDCYIVCLEKKQTNTYVENEKDSHVDFLTFGPTGTWIVLHH